MAPSSPATVVVLEKNSAAQELIDQALRDCGHRVLVTGDPDETLELAERVRIDLLVCDHGFCEKLLERIRSAQPSLRMLRVRPPFSLRELEAAIASALAVGQ